MSAYDEAAMARRPGATGVTESTAVARLGAGISTALRRYWHGRRAILIFAQTGPQAGDLIRQLEACGAVVLAVVSGGGPTPKVRHVWDCHFGRSQRSLTRFDAWLRTEPTEVAAWLDRIDPERSSVILTSLLSESSQLFGRPVHGWRRPAYAIWEDKTRIETLWQAAEVPSPPSVTLPITSPTLSNRAAALGRGHGVVLAMDATGGYRAGGEGLRWVRNPQELATTLAQWEGVTAKVRIAEFVHGVPSSIIGLVLDSGVAVFDPIEIVTLRDRRSGGFVFCGSSTSWRPKHTASEAMRDLTRRVGRYLGDHAGYRGMYSVDGLLTEQGFLATELNPRHASGLGLRQAWPDFPSYLFHRGVTERISDLVDLDPAEVEAEIRRLVRQHPSHSIMIPLSGGDGTTEAWWRSEGTPQCAIRYQRTSTGVKVLHLVPMAPESVSGPAVAALAHALGSPELASFDDTTVVPTHGDCW